MIRKRHHKHHAEKTVLHLSQFERQTLAYLLYVLRVTSSHDYDYRREYENDPAKKARLGEWYVREIERQIAEKEAQNPPRAQNEEKFRTWVESGRLCDHELAAEYGIIMPAVHGDFDSTMGYEGEGI